MNSNIASMMQAEVHSVDMDATVAQLESLLTEHRLTWAPVLDDKGVVIGVVSAADLLQFHVQQRDPQAVRAWQLCTYKPIVVDPATPAREVARLMVDKRIHHVVVTDSHGIVGVVSSLDFVRRFSDAG
jgi:CBS-domain-containing membrane protein